MTDILVENEIADDIQSLSAPLLHRMRIMKQHLLQNVAASEYIKVRT
jgi:hypothetical protein